MNAKNIKTFAFLLSIVKLAHMWYLLMAHAGGALGGDIWHAAGAWALGLPWGNINSTGMRNFQHRFALFWHIFTFLHMAGPAVIDDFACIS